MARSSAVLALTATGLMAQPVTYSQGTFNAADWSRTVLDQTGGMIDNTATTAGGAEWQVSVSRPASGATGNLRVSMINSMFVYDPTVNGTLSNISFSFDLFGVSSTGLSSAFFGYFRPIISQNGRFFSVSGVNATATAGTWTTFQGNFSAADDWVSAIAGDLTQLDFTGAAGVLEFGWRYQSAVTCSAASCSGFEHTALLDNFSVSASPATSTVPEPSTYVLLASGLAAMGLVARRRRATL